MRDDDVFEAVRRLVADGEYLDDLWGRPGVDLDGGGAFQRTAEGELRRAYTRGSRRFREARERGWVEPLPALTPAPVAAVEEAEELAGVALPPLLRRLYLEVGNGGFGPAGGVLGLRGGHSSEGGTAVRWLGPGAGDGATAPRVPMTLCNWGCAITTEIDLADGRMWGSDPNPAPEDVSCLFPQDLTVAEWFGRWIEGSLYQPWLVQDPVSGEWRGANDAEYAEVAEEFDLDE